MNIDALPNMSGQDCVAALQKAEFVLARERDDHFVLYHKDAPLQITVPNARELDRLTIGAILKEAGISVDEFLWLL